MREDFEDGYIIIPYNGSDTYQFMVAREHDSEFGNYISCVGLAVNREEARAMVSEDRELVTIKFPTFEETKSNITAFGSLISFAPPTEMSFSLSIDDIKKVAPKPGELLVFKVSEKQDGLYDSIRNTLDGWGYTNIQFVVMIKGGDVSSLNEEEMAKHGWVKKRENRGFEFL